MDLVFPDAVPHTALHVDLVFPDAVPHTERLVEVNDTVPEVIVWTSKIVRETLNPSETYKSVLL